MVNMFQILILACEDGNDSCLKDGEAVIADSGFEQVNIKY